DAFAAIERLVVGAEAPEASWAPPPPVGRERELAKLAEARVGVRYVVGESGVGKSHLAREVFTRALLAGRDARYLSVPIEPPHLIARLMAFFRGADDAWPFAPSRAR